MSMVSIGLPVYNGEKYLAKAIESILGQKFSNFELIICDNASTDGTEDICKRYSNQDRRIKYHRNKENIGAAANFNLTYKFSKYEYFKWAAHDDLLSPDYLSKCVKVLDSQPSVVLCYSMVTFIDEQGGTIGNYESKLTKASASRKQDRFADLILIDHHCYEVFGLFRRSVLSKTQLLESYVGSDRVLLAYIGLLGPFYEIPEYLFYSRHHGERSVGIDLHLRTEWFDPRKKDQIAFVYWRYLTEYFKNVNHAPLSSYERRMCYKNIIRWVCLWWRHLRGDVRIAGKRYISNLLG